MVPRSVGTKSLLKKMCGTHICYLLENRKIDRDLLGPCVGETEFRSMKPQRQRGKSLACANTPQGPTLMWFSVPEAL